MDDQIRIWKGYLPIHALKSVETIALDAKDEVEMRCLPRKYRPDAQRQSPDTGRLNPSNAERLRQRFSDQRACTKI